MYDQKENIQALMNIDFYNIILLLNTKIFIIVEYKYFQSYNNIIGKHNIFLNNQPYYLELFKIDFNRKEYDNTFFKITIYQKEKQTDKFNKNKANAFSLCLLHICDDLYFLTLIYNQQ